MLSQPNMPRHVARVAGLAAAGTGAAALAAYLYKQHKHIAKNKRGQNVSNRLAKTRQNKNRLAKTRQNEKNNLAKTRQNEKNKLAARNKQAAENQQARNKRAAENQQARNKQDAEDEGQVLWDALMQEEKRVHASRQSQIDDFTTRWVAEFEKAIPSGLRQLPPYTLWKSTRRSNFKIPNAAVWAAFQKEGDNYNDKLGLSRQQLSMYEKEFHRLGFALNPVNTQDRLFFNPDYLKKKAISNKS